MSKTLHIKQLDFRPNPANRPGMLFHRTDSLGHNSRLKFHRPNSHRLPRLLRIINRAINEGLVTVDYNEDSWLTLYLGE